MLLKTTCPTFPAAAAYAAAAEAYAAAAEAYAAAAAAYADSVKIKLNSAQSS